MLTLFHAPRSRSRRIVWLQEEGTPNIRRTAPCWTPILARIMDRPANAAAMARDGALPLAKIA